MAFCTAASQLSPTGWAKFRGNAQNTGQSSVGGATSTLIWATPLADLQFSSPVTGPNGTVYVAAGASVYALNGSTGAILWSYATHNVIYSSPLVGQDGTVYIGSLDAHMYALNGSTGALKWSFAAAGYIVSSATMDSNGVLYFGDWENGPTVGHLYALASSTGIQKWSIPTAGIVSSPALGTNGDLYVGSCDFNLYALNPNTGAEIWAFATSGHVESAPAIGPDGTVYATSDDGNLYAINGATGTLIWSHIVGKSFGLTPSFVSSPAIGNNGLVYVGSNNESLYALEASTGTLVWEYATTASIPSSPVIDVNGNVYIGPANGTVRSINGMTGLLNWEAIPGGASDSSPAIGVDGTVYVGVGGGIAAFESIHLATLTLNPSSVAAGSTATGIVNLNVAAPAGGAVVMLTSSDSEVSLPESVTIAAGQTSATLTLTVAGVNASVSSQITATYNGYALTKPLNLTMATLTSVTLPSSVVGGNGVVGTVNLSGPAGSSGASVNLTTTSSALTIPAQVQVSAGATSAHFNVTTLGVSASTSANISATYGPSNATGSMTVLPALLSSVTATLSGSNYVVTVTLNGNAPTGGTAVKLTSNSSAFVVPAAITVPVNASSASTTVIPLSVAVSTQVVVTATYGSASQQATVTLIPLTVQSITFSPSELYGGTTSSCTITLNGPTPSGGTKVSLSSGNSCVTVPSSVTVATGNSSLTFSVSTKKVPTAVQVTITSTLNKISRQAILVVEPPITVSSVSVSPSAVIGGFGAAGTVTLSAPVPFGTITVPLALDSTEATVASSNLTLVTGQSSISFAISTKPTKTLTSSTISCNYNGSLRSAKLTINPLTIVSLSLDSIGVGIGMTINATVTISVPAPAGGLSVALKSSSVNEAVPTTVLVPGGQTSAVFSISGIKASTVDDTITASYGSSTMTANVFCFGQGAVKSMSITKLGQGSQPVFTVFLYAPIPSNSIAEYTCHWPDQNNPNLNYQIAIAGTPALFFDLPVTVNPIVGSDGDYWVKDSTGREVSSELYLQLLTVQSLAVSSSTVSGTGSVTGAISLNGAARDGLVVSLKSSDPSVKVPATVSIQGDISATFALSVSAVTANKTVTITASANGHSESVTLTLQKS